MYRLYTTIIISFLTSTLFANASISHSQYTELVSIVKQQQFLAKKVSKYYVDFQTDQSNPHTKAKMKQSIQHFNLNHQKLINNKNNTQLINKKLTKVDEIWEIAHNLSETKKLSSLVVTSMNDINRKMKELSQLYKASYR